MGHSNAVLSDDFRDCIECLNAHGVRYVLVGGYAVGWHGVVRATGDIDFLYERTPANVRRLCDALEEFGAPSHVIDAAFMLMPDAVTQIGRAPFRIDLLASVSGVTFDEVYQGAERIRLDGHRLLVIGLRELRRNKAASGRPKDRSDLRRLGTAAEEADGSRRPDGGERPSASAKSPRRPQRHDRSGDR